MPTFISVFNPSQFGSPDPSGLAYNPVAGGLFLLDSEVDETPFFSDTNMFSVNFDGSLQQSYAFTSVSTDPTGVAFEDRKNVASGTSVAVRVALGGRRLYKKTTYNR